VSGKDYQLLITAILVIIQVVHEVNEKEHK